MNIFKYMSLAMKIRRAIKHEDITLGELVKIAPDFLTFGVQTWNDVKDKDVSKKDITRFNKRLLAIVEKLKGDSRPCLEK
jgi:hypothetical protein